MKKLLVLVLACMLIFSVVGCTSQTPNGSAESNPSSDAASNSSSKEETSATTKKIPIRWMNIQAEGSPSYEQYVKAVADFNAANDKYEIISDQPNDIGTKLMVEYSSGTGPEIAWSLMVYSKKLAEDNLVIDWRDVYKDPRNADLASWFSDDVKNTPDYGDGRLIMLPHEASIDGLYYNAEMFEKYGWELPETFDDMIELAGQVKNDGKYLLSCGAADIRFAWLTSILVSRTKGVDALNHITFGEGLKDWDNPEYGFPQALQKFKDLVDAEAYYPGTLGMTTAEADQLFASEQVAMYYEGAWKVGNFIDIGGREFIDKVKIISFPTMKDMDGDVESCTGGVLTGWVIKADLDDETKQTCIDFMKTIVCPEFWTGMMESGATLYAGTLDYDRSKTPAVLNDLYDRFQAGHVMVPSIDCTLDTAMQDAIVKSAFPGIMGGTMTVEEAVKLVGDTGRTVYQDLYE